MATAAVHSIDHFCIAVPDLVEATRFFESFGLEVTAEGGRLLLCTAGDSRPWGVLVPGPSKKLSYLSFAAFEGDLEAISARVKTAGCLSIQAPDHAIDPSGLWFSDLNGIPLQVRTSAKRTLDQKMVISPRHEASAGRAAPIRGTTPMVHPERLSHILIFTPDVPSSVAFYELTLGLRLSDNSADAVAFMHAVHGCDHHLVAFAKGQGTGVHHTSWAVAALDNVGLGAEQMRAAGYDRGWGLGRHVLGSNYFHYVRDPWGSYAEYSFDIDYIPPSSDWEATSPPVENSLYLWGPAVPDDFIVNYEAAGVAAAR